MKIRLANKFDLPHFIEMVKHFQTSTDLPTSIRNITHDNSNVEYINKLFHHMIIGGGLVLIAESDKPIGMIVGLKSPNIWDPEQISIQELMLWVEPEYRTTRAGYMLVKKFSETVKEMIEDKQIMAASMTNTDNLVNIDYSRFGFKKFQETWVIGV